MMPRTTMIGCMTLTGVAAGIGCRVGSADANRGEWPEADAGGDRCLFCGVAAENALWICFFERVDLGRLARSDELISRTDKPGSSQYVGDLFLLV